MSQIMSKYDSWNNCEELPKKTKKKIGIHFKLAEEFNIAFKNFPKVIESELSLTIPFEKKESGVRN